MAAKFTVLPKAPSLRELAHEVRLKEYFSYGFLPSSPDGLATAPLFAAYAASSPGAGEVFLMEGGSGAAEKLTVLPKAPSLRELAHEVRLKELTHIFPAKRIKSA